jgi:hypothetical protein
MRALLALVGIAAVVVIALVWLGLLNVKTTAGSLPSLHWEGGQAPTVTANMATVSVGTENKTISVPTVTTTDKTITVPTVSVNKPDDTSTAGNTQ